MGLWITHWAFQGLKLLLFSIVAFMGAFVGCVPFATLDYALKRLVEPGQLTNVASVLISGSALVVALAVGTAAFASMLKDHPLQPFGRRPTEEGKPTR